MGHGGKRDNTEFLKTIDGTVFKVKEKIAEIFDNNKFSHLKDKPKVFILQSCRGGKCRNYKKNLLMSKNSASLGLNNNNMSILQRVNTKNPKKTEVQFVVLVPSQIT